jgi:hypothetical protein
VQVAGARFVVGRFGKADVAPQPHELLEEDIILPISAGSIPAQEDGAFDLPLLEHGREFKEFRPEDTVLNRPLAIDRKISILLISRVPLINNSVLAKARNGQIGDRQPGTLCEFNIPHSLILQRIFLVFRIIRAFAIVDEVLNVCSAKNSYKKIIRLLIVTRFYPLVQLD